MTSPHYSTAHPGDESPCDLDVEQQKDPELCRMRQFLEFGILPAEGEAAKSLAAQALNFTMVDNVLYYVDGKNRGHRRAAVPRHLQRSILEDYHAGKMAGHFSGLDCMLLSADSGGGVLCTRT